jgi:hypothetical protein
MGLLHDGESILLDRQRLARVVDDEGVDAALPIPSGTHAARRLLHEFRALTPTSR